MPGKKKADCRQLADFASAYGFTPAGLDYGQFVGLVQNIPRVELRRALAVLLGSAAAGSLEPLGLAWFDALAEYETQAPSLEYETNAARAEARVQRRRRG